MANFTQAGSQKLLELIGEGGTVPADNLWIGLASGTLSNTSTLANITEVGGTRKNITSANWSVTAGVATTGTPLQWGPGVTVTGATTWFLCDVASGTAGTLFCYNSLAATRTLTTADTEAVDVTDIHIS
jgi:hypothetical protein